MSLIPTLQAYYQPPAPIPPPHPLKGGDVKALTAFTGEDHTKLHDFLFKCGLIFNTKPRTFITKKSSILYVIEHLNGMAKQHFHHYIKAGSTNPKVNQWDLFISKLETVFSDPDCIGRASDKILGLKMKETSQVHCYTILFKEAANELSWPESVLHQLYYISLPNRIKDLWARSNPPLMTLFVKLNTLTTVTGSASMRKRNLTQLRNIP